MLLFSAAYFKKHCMRCAMMQINLLLNLAVCSDDDRAKAKRRHELDAHAKKTAAN